VTKELLCSSRSQTLFGNEFVFVILIVVNFYFWIGIIEAIIIEFKGDNVKWKGGRKSSIGDDTLQRKATGHVRPDAFIHGSSAQRVEWFRRGLRSGDIRQCNTFQ